MRSVIILCFFYIGTVRGLNRVCIATSCYIWCLFHECLNSVTLSLLPSLQVNSHAGIRRGKRRRRRRAGIKKKRVVGGRDCEKVIEKQWLREIKCLCEHAGACLSSRDRARRGRTANYDSSGMSPELSAKMEIKRAVSGPTASQSDSHVNNIGGICCNLGIIYAAPPRPREKGEKKKGQFVL